LIVIGLALPISSIEKEKSKASLHPSKYCGGCGKEVLDKNAQFCTYCGYKLRSRM